MRGIRRVRALFVLMLALAGALAVTDGSAQASTTSVVMTGLANPRGINFAANGALYVAESGTGGPGQCDEATGDTSCFGLTGSVSLLFNGHQERVVTGLPSYFSADDFAVLGPSDVAFQGGSGYVSIGLGGDAGTRAFFEPVGGALLGQIVKFEPSGHYAAFADEVPYEEVQQQTRPGDVTGTDIEPYGMLAQPGDILLTDSAANVLNQVDRNGSWSTVAVLPARPRGGYDSVPTAVAQGPDGAYYVSGLSGQPFLPGDANVYRVVPGQAPTVAQSGLSMAIDIAFGPDGSMYIVEFATVFFPSGFPGFTFPAPGTGELLRIAPNGTRTVVAAGLDYPTSVAIGPDGAFYVTNHGLSYTDGQVLRIVP